MGIITPLEPYVYALPTRLGACEGGGAALQLQHAWRRWEREACPHEMRDAANATQRLIRPFKALRQFAPGIAVCSAYGGGR